MLFALSKTRECGITRSMAEEPCVRPYVYSQVVPAGLKGLEFAIRLESSGVFEFGKISWLRWADVRRRRY